jgi:hypothetical protein
VRLRMANEFAFPDSKSVVYWPIGCGDSTSIIVVPGQITAQIDIRHCAKADDDEEPEWPIIDHLAKALPKRNGRPYLALFALTHPDRDHIQGFPELLRRVDIGEIWHTPRIFRDQSDQETLCDDAKAFRSEAHRRRKAILANPTTIKSGDRLRVIGHDDILLEPDYKGLPETCKSRPGELITEIDGVSLTGHFQAFVHAPFKDDQAKDRNNTSLSLNVVLWEGENHGQFFFFGDREYPTIKRIFETTEAGEENKPYLFWDVMLCSHHCSKAVMYWRDTPDGPETFRKDIMDYFEKYSQNASGYAVASAHSTFTSGSGDNPPHSLARARYEEIVKPGQFLCTHEYPSKRNPEPLVFVVDADGFRFVDARGRTQGPSGLASVVTSARGATQPPSTQVGFGVA